MAQSNNKAKPADQKVFAGGSEGAQRVHRGVLAKQVQEVLEKNRLEARVADIVVRKRKRKDLGDIDDLAAKISDVGLLHPLPVRKEGRRYVLVCGERRLEAFKRLGRETIPIFIVTGLADAAAALRAERDENLCRKDFTPSEALALGKELEALERQEAKGRQQEGGKAGARSTNEKLGRATEETAPGNLPEPDKGQTRDKVAEVVGMSGRTYEKAKQVVDAAEADPSLQPVVEEMDRTGKVDPAHRKVKAKAEADGHRGEAGCEGDDQAKKRMEDREAAIREAEKKLHRAAIAFTIARYEATDADGDADRENRADKAVLKASERLEEAAIAYGTVARGKGG
jgi:ParB-like chromosome segregation protein Spo0J